MSEWAREVAVDGTVIYERPNGDRRYHFADGTVVARKEFNGCYYTLSEPGPARDLHATEGSDNERRGTMGMIKHGAGEVLPDPQQEQPAPQGDRHEGAPDPERAREETYVEGQDR